MLYPTPRILYIILFLVFGCTSCSSPPAALQRTLTPEAATAAPVIPTQPVQITPLVKPTQLASAILDESLTQALQLTPVDARSVAFTNWTLAKAYADADDLTGDSNIKKQVDFYYTINQQALDFTLAAGLFIDATVWSFGSVDLLWDARIDYTTTYSQSSHLFKFPSTFDLNPVLAHFDQYGYQQERYGDATLYTRQPDLNAPWYNQVPFGAIFNAAVLPDEHMLIFSATKEGVQRIIDLHDNSDQTLGDAAAIQSLAQQLGTTQTALIYTSAAACERYQASTMLETLKKQSGNRPTITVLEEQVGTQLANLHAYTALGYGFRREADKPLAVAVFTYPNAEDAQNDYPIRRDLAENGKSSMTRRLYKDSLFTVKTAAVEEQNIILQLQPYAERTFLLSSPVIVKRDLLFAACPGQDQ